MLVHLFIYPAASVRPGPLPPLFSIFMQPRFPAIVERPFSFIRLRVCDVYTDPPGINKVWEMMHIRAALQTIAERTSIGAREAAIRPVCSICLRLLDRRTGGSSPVLECAAVTPRVRAVA